MKKIFLGISLILVVLCVVGCSVNIQSQTSPNQDKAILYVYLDGASYPVAEVIKDCEITVVEGKQLNRSQEEKFVSIEIPPMRNHSQTSDSLVLMGPDNEKIDSRPLWPGKYKVIQWDQGGLGIIEN